MTKRIFLVIIYCFFAKNGISQITFSNIDSKLKYNTSSTGTDLFCNGSAFSFKFKLTSNSIRILNNNLISVDSQVIQIALLKVDSLKNGFNNLTIQQEQQLLTDYSNYELNYFAQDLKVEIINPNSQWVNTKSRKWLVWYFRVGSVPTTVENKTAIQLFASTIIGNKILDINAPISTDGDFTKASLIVNELMETLTTKQ